MSGEIPKVIVAETRRRWSEDEKRAITEECRTTPVSQVAKKYGLSSGLLFRWRKQRGLPVRSWGAQGPEQQRFVPIAVRREVVEPGNGAATIEIVLRSGRRVVVGKDFDDSTLRRVIEALEPV
jgi:transposase